MLLGLAMSLLPSCKKNARLGSDLFKRPSVILGFLIMISFQISCSKMALRQHASIACETDPTGAIIAQKVRICAPVKYLSESRARPREKSYIRHLEVRWIDSPAAAGN